MGGIALRHIFDDQLGHIGYGVRSSGRRRGLAGWALAQMLNEAKAALALDRVLIICEADNVASARTIERNRGVLECIRDGSHGALRCCRRSVWLGLTSSRPARQIAATGRPRALSPKTGCEAGHFLAREDEAVRYPRTADDLPAWRHRSGSPGFGRSVIAF